MGLFVRGLVLLSGLLTAAAQSPCSVDFFGAGCMQVYNVTTVAGVYGPTGYADGTGLVTRFNRPSGMALDASGNLYVSDNGNSAIRVLNVTTGAVKTVYLGGPVSGPMGLAFDSGGGLWYTDIGVSGTSPYIRKINLTSWVVTWVAGNGGQGTSNSMTGTSAAFRSPKALTFGTGGLLYVADSGNFAIRVVNTSSSTYPVSILAGGGGTGTSSGYADGVGTAALFANIFSIHYCRLNGTLVVLDAHNVRIVDPVSTNVTTLAGCGTNGSYQDGQGTNACISLPSLGTLDSACNLYFQDYVATGVAVVRMVTPAGVVTTVAGSVSAFRVVG